MVDGRGVVGLGTDFDGISDPREGFEDVSRYPRITEELLRRGHPEEVVRKVLGENFLRFFTRVEIVSHSLAAEPASAARLEKQEGIALGREGVAPASTQRPVQAPAGATMIAPRMRRCRSHDSRARAAQISAKAAPCDAVNGSRKTRTARRNWQLGAM